MEVKRWRDFWRFIAYAVATLVPVVWLGLALSNTAAQEIDAALLRQGEMQTRAIAESAIEPFLQGQPLAEGLTADERKAFGITTGDLVRRGRVLVLRIRDVNGRVVFDAASPDAAPGPLTISEEVQEAAAEGMISTLTHVGHDAVDGGKAHGPAAVESYVALYSSHPHVSHAVVGVVEMYVPYEPIAIQNLKRAIFVGLAVLWVLLATVVGTTMQHSRRHRRRTEFMALHDPLTGLPNRTLYADRLSAALASAARLGTDVALAVVDLDRFKEVNDTLGHRNGDEFLKIIAQRLTLALRPGDTIARLGGNEFGLVLPGAKADSVEGVLWKLQESLGQEAELAGVAISAEVSIGYVMWPEDAEAADILMRRADLALHAAKAARAAIVRYHPGIDEFDPQRLGLIAELRRAITAGELVLHYQPKVDARSGQVHAFEALVRWVHPVRGLIPPNDFIPIAESTGLIGPLTHWVVDSALAQLAEWSVTRPGLSVAVNISARNLRDDLPGWILNRLASHRVKASQLVLEITETSFATDPVRATAMLEELSAAGVRVSLDDFGQGYTSLGSLGHLPVSELKIDRGFVVAMQHSPEDHAIVASVIELGHQLGLTVVAEGVETAEVFADLCRLGCDTMQGYLFSPAVPASEAFHLMDRCYATV